MANHDGADADIDVTIARDAVIRHPSANLEEARKVRDLGEAEYMRQARNEALEWIANHPAEFLRLTLMRFVYFWCGPLRSPWPTVVTAPVTILALLGLRRTLPALTIPQRAALLIPLAAFPLVYYVVSCVGHYRAPLEWMLLLLAAAIGLVGWGGAGFYRGLHSGFTGGLYDPEYRVPGVRPGGSADRAGFKAGDRVFSVEGRPVEELGMESRWPRSLAPKIGQTHRFVVERKGERLSLDLVYDPPFRAAVNNRIGAALVGFGFLCFGLWAFFTAGTSPALALAHIGLAAGVAMSSGPNLGSWNGVKDHVSTASNVLMYILMLRFLVNFPKPKPVSGSRLAAWAIYGAWGCLLVFLVAEPIVHPVLYYTTGSVAGPLMPVYGLLILAAITHTVVKTPRAELREPGMNLILGGFLVAIAGIALAFVPGLNLPGWTSALPILAIPFTMALAVRRQARLEATWATTAGAAP